MKNKHAQLTLFIIIALVIVALLLVLFYPRIKTIISGPVPTDYIKECGEKATKEVLDKVRMQGGSLEPENYILYDGNKVDYACYTNEYYKTCVMQKPFLKQDIEKEIINYVEPKVKKCAAELKSQLEKSGSSVTLQDIKVIASIIPNSVLVNVNVPMTVTKGSTARLEKFKINVNSQLYDLTILASAIANYEARYGSSDSLTYMLYYPDIKVEKKELSDGETIYILTYKPTNEKFMFASRSIAWPAGYIGDRTK